MAESTTGRLHRCEPGTPGDKNFEAIVARSKFRHATIVPAAPIPTIPPGRHGDLSRASIDQLVALTRGVWPAGSTAVGNRRLAVRRFLAHLETLPGDTWQERWDASDLAAGGRRLGLKETDEIAPYRASVGMKLMFCLRVIRPTLPALRMHRSRTTRTCSMPFRATPSSTASTSM